MERTPPWFDYDRDWLQPDFEDEVDQEEDEDELFDRWQDDLAMARL